MAVLLGFAWPGGLEPLRRARPLAAAAALALALPGAPRADPVPPLAITVTGAVSLGSYEAGALYYLLEALRLNPGLRELRLVTGTSAGSANGILAILQHCGPDPGPPPESLFWRSWIPVGIRQLHLPDAGTALGAFSRKALLEQADRLRQAWDRGLRSSCDVVVGVSATRVVPRLVRMSPEQLRLPRIDEQFVLRVQGRGPGLPPRLTNYVDPGWQGEQLLLPEDGSGEVPFAALQDLLLASVAFPGAFEPQPLAHCLSAPGRAGPARCPATEAPTELFLDGGMLDNTPLRLAVRLARAGLREGAGGGSGWSDTPRLAGGEFPAPTLFAYVSPGVIDYPGEELPRPATARPQILDHLSRVAGAFVDAALVRNLLTLVEDDPAIGARVAVPVRSLPAAGSPLASFFGFFEEEFRRFDFQLGMYEARRMITSDRGARRWTSGLLPEERGPREAWRPLACLRAVVDGAGDPAAACAGDDLADFRILLQVSLERLRDRCSRGDGRGYEPDHALCCAARDGSPLPVVPGVRPLAGPWRQRASESLVAYVMRLLVGHGFRFRDHGLEPEQAKEAPAALRHQLVAIGKTISRRQPIADAVMVDTLVALGSDSIVYVPPRNTIWVSLGRDAELGWSHGFFDAFEETRWFRLHAAVQLNRLGTAISSDPGPLSATLLGGAELLPPRISTTRFQLGALLRVGWQVSPIDDYGVRPCPRPDVDELGVCSRPVLQAGAVGAILERVRLHLIGSWYPPYWGTRRPLWALSPAAGIEWTF